MTRFVPCCIPLLFSLPACSSSPPPADPSNQKAAPEQQRIIDRAAQAVSNMRSSPRLSERFESYTESAHAVVVFPRLIKASVVFGGEGGNGVMVVRQADGSWSAPAFYSLGAASAGLQVGYQETSAVFFIMTERTLERALDSDFRLGADASVAAGYVGEGGKGVAGVASEDIVVLAEVGGAYVGVSFDGHVMAPRDKHNHAYYGRALEPRDVFAIAPGDAPGGADAVALALASDKVSGARPPGTKPPAPGRAAQGSAGEAPATSPPGSGASPPDPDASASEPSEAAPGAVSDAPAHRECSPESRQAQVCAEIYAPVCAQVDTGVRCVAPPCNESRTEKTFPNACAACREARVMGYRDGPCEAE